MERDPPEDVFNASHGNYSNHIHIYLKNFPIVSTYSIHNFYSIQFYFYLILFQ